ncbi:hypothetical protein HanRHA438_Chr03g0124831 [Helianthus annuus]|nr:hypothetical protein HanRHA438_Chr03g0124831 [Helianthus annuus]
MATAQVVSATTALHDEKIEEKSNVEIGEDIKSTNDQETTPQPQEDQPPKEKPLDDITVAPEPDVAAPEVLEAKPEPKVETKTETEAEAVPEPTEVAKSEGEPKEESEKKEEGAAAE